MLINLDIPKYVSKVSSPIFPLQHALLSPSRFAVVALTLTQSWLRCKQSLAKTPRDLFKGFKKLHAGARIPNTGPQNRLLACAWQHRPQALELLFLRRPAQNINKMQQISSTRNSTRLRGRIWCVFRFFWTLGQCVLVAWISAPAQPLLLP